MYIYMTAHLEISFIINYTFGKCSRHFTSSLVQTIVSRVEVGGRCSYERPDAVLFGIDGWTMISVSMMALHWSS